MNISELLDEYTQDLNDLLEGSTSGYEKEMGEHVLWMISEIPKLGDEGKVNRWLGFIQGYFWVMGLYTIDEMREHVRLILK